MKYLCLIYESEQAWATMSKEEGDAIMGEYFAFTDTYRASGQVIAGSALQPTNTATTVRLRNGKISTTDGPFAETREQLGGYFMIEAKDVKEAIAVARRIPAARNGSIEVRPIVEFEGSDLPG